MGSFWVDEQEVNYAAVDPATFRRFTPQGTAQTQARLGPGRRRRDRGRARPSPRSLQTTDGYLRLGNETASPKVHIGAYAQILDPSYARQIDAVVNYQVGQGPSSGCTRTTR